MLEEKINHNPNRVGRSEVCVNATTQEQTKHRMRTLYIRASMSSETPRNSRSMIPVGFYCPKCDRVWTIQQQEEKMI
jgi:hypothetical protein